MDKMAEEKFMTRKELSKKVGISAGRLTMFLCRAEFSHIRFGKMGRERVYKDITSRDINKLKALKKVNRCLYKGYDYSLARSV